MSRDGAWYDLMGAPYDQDADQTPPNGIHIGPLVELAEWERIRIREVVASELVNPVASVDTVRLWIVKLDEEVRRRPRDGRLKAAIDSLRAKVNDAERISGGACPECLTHHQPGQNSMCSR